MKKTLCTVAATLCVVAATEGHAVEPVNNFFVKVIGKYTLMGDIEATELVELDTEGGWGIGGAVGAQIQMIKVEVEVATQKNDIDHLEIGPRGERITRSGDVELDTLLLNAYFDLPVGKGLSLYAGGGAGAGIFTLSAFDFDEDETVFAYKFGAGISYLFHPSLGVELGYEYLATEDAEINDIEVSDIASNNILLAFKYLF